MSDKFTKDDLPYLQRVSKEIEPDLALLGFETYAWNRVHNSGLKIQPADKSLWTVGGTSYTEEKVGIHFERIESGALRLDVEVLPYETKIDAVRLQELEQINVPKVEVMKQLREHLMNKSEISRHFIVKKGRYNHAYPSACEALRFSVLPEKNLYRSEYGKFCLDVVKRVAPLIDEWLAQNKNKWEA